MQQNLIIGFKLSVIFLLYGIKNLIINLDQEQKKVKVKKRDDYKSAYALYEGQELTLNAFKSRMLPIKATQGEELKILIPK